MDIVNMCTSQIDRFFTLKYTHEKTPTKNSHKMTSRVDIYNFLAIFAIYDQLILGGLGIFHIHFRRV